MTESASLRRHWLLLAVVITGGIGLRLYGIGSQPFWLDEAHSANFIRQSFGELWAWSSPYDKGNPPGYITLLKLWSQVSTSDVWLRLFSAAAGSLTLGVVYVIGRRIADRRAALTATALLALSGYHIRFSQEARTYALMGLVSAVVMLAVAQLITRPDGDHAEQIRGQRPWTVRAEGLGLRRPLTWTDLAWPTYSLGAGIAFLLHSTGVALAVAANITVAVWWLSTRPRPPRFARNWMLSNLFAVSIWLTWLPGFLRQLSSITASWWVPAPTLFSVAQGGADLTAPSFGWQLPWNDQSWWAVILVAGAFAVIWLGTRPLPIGPKVLIWTFLLALPAIEVVFSLRRPIFLTRTLVGILVPATVAVAIALAGPRKLLSNTALAIALAVAASGAVAYHTTYEKTAWDQAAAIVAKEARPGDIVLVQPANTVVAFNHYFEQTSSGTRVYATPSRLPERLDSGSVVTATDRDLIRRLAESSGDIWLVLNRPDQGESVAPVLDEIRESAARTNLTDLVLIRYR